MIDVEIGYCEDACHGEVDDDNEDDKKIEEKMMTAIAKITFWWVQLVIKKHPVSNLHERNKGVVWK